MQYFLIGGLVLAVGLVLLHRFTLANPSRLARQLKIAGGIALLVMAAALLARGNVSYALTLAVPGVWLLWGDTAIRRAQPTPGNASRIVTEHLEMELDHDSGEMQGRVLKGLFAGRQLSDMRPADIALVWQDCRFHDPKSAQLLEAYLDRRFPSWREHMARGEEEMASGPDGRMSRDEALEILGLDAGASQDDIRRAHRELMLKLHPDRGGSTYLAAKINEAKDVLLG